MFLGRRALLADDDAVSQEVLRRRLKQLGFRCDVVSNGQEAIAELLRRAYDVILMDCQMPGVNGKEATLAIRLREIDGQHQRTPIIAVTAFGEDFSEPACRAAGMDAFLGKPVSMDRLKRTLDRVLDRDLDQPGLVHLADQSLRAPPVCLGDSRKR